MWLRNRNIHGRSGKGQGDSAGCQNSRKDHQRTVGQLPVLQDGVDVIMLTTRYGKPLNKPIIQVFGLISGINEDAVAEEIISTCRDVLNQS